MKNSIDKKVINTTVSNLESTLSNTELPTDISNENVEEVKEGGDKTNTQRRPQFRSNENNKRRKYN